MNTGQMLLTMGALGLLSFAVLNMNRGIDEHDIGLAQNRYRLEALSIMNSHIEQCQLYFFDEASTDTSNSKTLADFSDPSSLGLEANDNGTPDDFDDFHEYTVSDTGNSGIRYSLSFEVDYVVIQSNELTTSATRQYNKRMKIYVTDDYDDPLIYKYENSQRVKDTLKVEFVNSYWFYN